ncbi:ABC transporter ATP-binding protein [Fusobacterium nucleatum subsp. nucleatum]|uniref:ABC transporter ATP-binding protein n=1 Tax=Fusobacterium nucleatum subsp. nucleatum TaxID=76856 RepID=A0A0X3Y0X6_FUSNC|nr:ABC transporter ATP-binding protein [Fusobacterium nucleatum]ALF24222.1 ABC transporter ATP-binding protein [Fusobacterium nucleatum subsp. nucleatum ChDC F316]ASG26492.1 ABC transporter ATP-binding protein [Fusobacterium nucleatum subsp. nucleatum]KUL98602.1 ABC transporter ATP-binding protein [Fusobacterium nucleatum subsp. nucleatum]
MLEIKDLSFSYNKHEENIFENLSINFAKGFNVILGPNGAGKSTLLKAIFGLLRYQGYIYYDDINLSKINFNKKVELISYLPQMDLNISPLTVLEMVLLGRLPELNQKISDEDIKAVTEILKALNIENLITRTFSELSGGQKKMVFIAQTLVRNPKLILLDEPTNSLDLQKQLELCQFLKNFIELKKVDIVTVLHDINLAIRYADYIVILSNKGKLYDSGEAKKVITEKMLREVYGVSGNVILDDENKPIISLKKSIRDK